MSNTYLILAVGTGLFLGGAMFLAILGVRIMSIVTDIQAKVTAEDTVIASAITLLQQLKTALDQAIQNGDLAALQALSDDIGTQTQNLAAAVAANTPAASTPAT